MEQNGLINRGVLDVAIMVELRKLERQTTIPVLSVGVNMVNIHMILPADRAIEIV